MPAATSKGLCPPHRAGVTRAAPCLRQSPLQGRCDGCHPVLRGCRRPRSCPGSGSAAPPSHAHSRLQDGGAVAVIPCLQVKGVKKPQMMQLDRLFLRKQEESWGWRLTFFVNYFYGQFTPPLPRICVCPAFSAYDPTTKTRARHKEMSCCC